ncbi:MAG TPA: DHH family phosphoesterase [Tepidisphaeraceae bacterium]
METVAGSAVAIERRSRGKPRARQLLRALHDKKKILITTHSSPDPDAMASCTALMQLLKVTLPSLKVEISFKGSIVSGMNAIFAQQADLQPVPWDEATLPDYDGIILLDTQPAFANCPLPAGIVPAAVIDHHRASRGRRSKCGFCDVRPDVGASSTIIFSYFMELEVPISGDLGATLLYAIESDLAGAAGQPGELDNIALSSLTLLADTRKLYKMRYVDLPQSYYVAYWEGLASAVHYDHAIIAHLDSIDSLEKPAIIADFLLRFDKVQWALVTALSGSTLMLSLRTSAAKPSAAEMMRRLVKKIGQGGGHRTKAGGGIPLQNTIPAEIARVRGILRRRLLRALNIQTSHAQRLVAAKA